MQIGAAKTGAGSAGQNLIGPNLETNERIGSEGRRDRYIERVAPPCDQHPSNPWDIVARVECVPASSEIRLEPGGKVHRTVWRRLSHVAEITGAVARWNVHASAECN